MYKKVFILFFVLLSLLIAGLLAFGKIQTDHKDLIIPYTVDLQKQDLRLYWKDDTGQVFGDIGSLKKWLDSKGKKLVFAMNAGMFDPSHSPQGLFIQDQQIIERLDTTSGRGNFYLKPNGVFYTTVENQAAICKTEDFIRQPAIKYATQSGPMLVINGQIHPAFKAGSTNVHIRNGVGILPDGQVLFAISSDKINLYDFASYFKDAGCQNALYLDGFVSCMYLPEKSWIENDAELGVLIGVTEQGK